MLALFSLPSSLGPRTHYSFHAPLPPSLPPPPLPSLNFRRTRLAVLDDALHDLVNDGNLLLVGHLPVERKVRPSATGTIA